MRQDKARGWGWGWGYSLDFKMDAKVTAWSLVPVVLVGPILFLISVIFSIHFKVGFPCLNERKLHVSVNSSFHAKKQAS